MEGGYYRFDINEKVGVLSFNSMTMSTRNRRIVSPDNLFRWFEQQLNDTSDIRFILQMHVPPGQWYINKEETFWREELLDRFLHICTKYQDKIVVLLGAHVHAADIRAPYSEKNKDLFNFTIMMTPGLSPVFGNNPGYTIL